MTGRRSGKIWLMVGDGVAGTDNSRSLYDELRAVRQTGLTRISGDAVPHLRRAAQDLDGGADLPAPEAVRRLILKAIDRLGEGPASISSRPA